jgi:hypothetical protein
VKCVNESHFLGFETSPLALSKGFAGVEVCLVFTCGMGLVSPETWPQPPNIVHLYEPTKDKLFQLVYHVLTSYYSEDKKEGQLPSSSKTLIK